MDPENQQSLAQAGSQMGGNLDSHCFNLYWEQLWKSL